VIDLATTTRQYLRVEEVCELFDVSRRTVYYWIQNNKIPSTHVAGSQRIPVPELRQLLASKRALPSLFVQSAKRTA
jgi:excisionase family DNA binding protein